MAGTATDATPPLPVRLRVGVKALVLRDGFVLCVRKRDAGGDLCTFPGGGQEPGETLVEAVRREFHEEVGRRVHVGELLFVREYIGRNHELAATDARLHAVDHVFRCTLLPPEGEPPAGAAPPPPWPGASVPPHADPGQVTVEWLPVAALDEPPFRPRALQPSLRELARGERPSAPVYVGDVN